MTTPSVPLTRSYCVIPGKLLAGYYPGSKNPKEATAKLTALINAGIRHFINLMELDERDRTGHLFVPYDDMMESIATKMKISVTFDQLPIKDLSIPTQRYMTRILDQIDLCIKHGKPVYVHCLGGIGRTGTVVGCYLVRHGLAIGKNVLDMIPIFMYLTDYRERCLKDVITQLEPGLFKKVTGLAVKDFELLVSLGVFNSALMNDAVFKFKRYEDASLSYTGINKHEGEDVGLYDTVLTQKDAQMVFENMPAGAGYGKMKIS